MFRQTDLESFRVKPLLNFGWNSYLKRKYFEWNVLFVLRMSYPHYEWIVIIYHNYIGWPLISIIKQGGDGKKGYATRRRKCGDRLCVRGIRGGMEKWMWRLMLGFHNFCAGREKKTKGAYLQRKITPFLGEETEKNLKSSKGDEIAKGIKRLFTLHDFKINVSA